MRYGRRQQSGQTRFESARAERVSTWEFHVEQNQNSSPYFWAYCLGVRRAAQAQFDWKKEWERSLQEAKKERVIVVGIPARAELRKELEAVFKPKFGIDMDLSTARGPQNASIWPLRFRVERTSLGE